VARDDAKLAAKKGLNMVTRARGEGARGAAGYNHSIRYKNHLVHVQTEDAGPRQAVVATHLFVGGHVFARRCASYADRRGAPDLPALVRQLVHHEHRAAFLALRNGEYDDALTRLSAHDEDRASGVLRTAASLARLLSSKPPAASHSAAPRALSAGPPRPSGAPSAGPPRPSGAPSVGPPHPSGAPSVGPPRPPETSSAGPSQPPEASLPQIPIASPPPVRGRVPTLPSIVVTPAEATRPAPAAAPPGTPTLLSPLALRSLDGYKASGVIDTASGALLAHDGPAGTGALAASLLDVAGGHRRALAEFGVDDEAGEFVLLGKASCLLVRPVSARAGFYVYVLCGRAPTNVARARLALTAVADGVG
jgi:hypothetical protein